MHEPTAPGFSQDRGQDPPLSHPIRFIDLFAGIGGIRLPFEEMGYQCVFSSEWDRAACDTYEANYGERPQGDITRIAAKDIPAHDLLLAGFPCQAFSIMGKMRGFEDTRGKHLIPRGRDPGTHRLQRRLGDHPTVTRIHKGDILLRFNPRPRPHSHTNGRPHIGGGRPFICGAGSRSSPRQAAAAHSPVPAAIRCIGAGRCATCRWNGWNHGK